MGPISPLLLLVLVLRFLHSFVNFVLSCWCVNGVSVFFRQLAALLVSASCLLGFSGRLSILRLRKGRARGRARPQITKH